MPISKYIHTDRQMGSIITIKKARKYSKDIFHIHFPMPNTDQQSKKTPEWKKNFPLQKFLK